MNKTIKGFTLIELLIVVAIIAILAAIAVPNFLEAQVRSKVSRAKADMRTLATALESYATDNNHYSPAERIIDNGYEHHVMKEQFLTTPIAYITASKIFIDPLKKSKSYLQERSYLYEYMNTEYFRAAGNTAGEDYFSRQYGSWRVICSGADGYVYNSNIKGPDGQGATWLLVSYDPSNGTVSVGDVIRTAKHPELSKTQN